MSEKPYYRIQSAQRAIQILKAFGPEQRVWGVSELSRAIRLPKNSVHRLLLTLEEEGMVQRDPETGGFRLGLEAFRIGMVYLGQWNLPEDSSRYLRALVRELDMMAHLAVLDAGHVMYVNVVFPPRYHGEEFSWAGRRNPPHHSALGKVLLAWLSEERRDAILASLDFRPCTMRTIANQADFVSHLCGVRMQGFAVDDQEVAEGWRCVAAPVFDHTGQVVAAISVTASARQLTTGRIPEVAERVCRSTRRLSEQLGYEERGG